MVSAATCGMSALRFFCHRQKNRSKRYVACSDVELLARFELAVPACGGLRFLLKQASPVRSPVQIFPRQTEKASGSPFVFPKNKPEAQRSGFGFERRSKGAERMVFSIPREIENAGAKRTLLRRGAAGQIRTGDLILTKDALYLLSYSSKVYAPNFGAYMWRPRRDLNPRPPA